MQRSAKGISLSNSDGQPTMGFTQVGQGVTTNEPQSMYGVVRAALMSNVYALQDRLMEYMLKSCIICAHEPPPLRPRRAAPHHRPSPWQTTLRGRTRASTSSCSSPARTTRCSR